MEFATNYARLVFALLNQQPPALLAQAAIVVPLTGFVGLALIKLTKVTEFQSAPNTPGLALILSVTNAIHQGLTRSQIIKEVLGYTGKRYAQVGELYDRIHAIIQENSTHD